MGPAHQCFARHLSMELTGWLEGGDCVPNASTSKGSLTPARPARSSLLASSIFTFTPLSFTTNTFTVRTRIIPTHTDAAIDVTGRPEGEEGREVKRVKRVIFITKIICCKLVATLIWLSQGFLEKHFT